MNSLTPLSTSTTSLKPNRRSLNKDKGIKLRELKQKNSMLTLITISTSKLAMIQNNSNTTMYSISEDLKIFLRHFKQ